MDFISDGDFAVDDQQTYPVTLNGMKRRVDYLKGLPSHLNADRLLSQIEKDQKMRLEAQAYIHEFDYTVDSNLKTTIHKIAVDLYDKMKQRNITDFNELIISLTVPDNEVLEDDFFADERGLQTEQHHITIQNPFIEFAQPFRSEDIGNFNMIRGKRMINAMKSHRKRKFSTSRRSIKRTIHYIPKIEEVLTKTGKRTIRRTTQRIKRKPFNISGRRTVRRTTQRIKRKSSAKTDKRYFRRALPIPKIVKTFYEKDQMIMYIEDVLTNQIGIKVNELLEKYELDFTYVDIMKVYIKAYEDVNNGAIYHFKHNFDEQQDIFTDDINTNAKIYTSTCLDYNCTFYAILYGIRKYLKLPDYKQGVPEKLINIYRRGQHKYTNVAVNPTEALRFAYYIVERLNVHHFIEDDLYSFNIPEDLTIHIRHLRANARSGNSTYCKSRTELTLCIYNYSHHTFFISNVSKKERFNNLIRDNFEILPFVDTCVTLPVKPTFEELIPHLETEIVTVNKEKDVKALVVAYDIETMNISQKEYADQLNLFYSVEPTDKIIKALATCEMSLAHYYYSRSTGPAFSIPQQRGNPLEINSSVFKEDPHKNPIMSLLNQIYNRLRNRRDLKYLIPNQMKEGKVVSKRLKVIMYAHNGCKFDALAMAPFFSKANCRLMNKVGAAKDCPTYEVVLELANDIGYDVFVEFTMLDTMKTIFLTSLENLCKTYQIDKSKRKVHIDNKEAFFRRMSDMFVAKFRDLPFDNTPLKIKELNKFKTFEAQADFYGKYDVISLLEIIMKFSIAFFYPELPKQLRQNAIGLVSSASLATKPLRYSLAKHKVQLTNSSVFNNMTRKAAKGGCSIMTSPGFTNLDALKEIDSNLINQHNKAQFRELLDSERTEKELKHLIYPDARSLYPSALILYKYPTRIISPEGEHKFTKDGKYDFQYIHDSIANCTTRTKLDKFLDRCPWGGIFRVRITHSEGLKPAIPLKVKGVLIYKHATKENPIEATVTSSDLLRLVAFNKGEFEILDGVIYRMKNIFEDVKTLYDLRNTYKRKMKEDEARYGVLQELVKLIMNSMYGKLLQKAFNTKLSTRTDFNALYMGVEEYGGQFLNVFKTYDNSYSMNHIGAFVLSHSKIIMDRLICHLGGEKNNHISMKHPWYSMDTDSLACYKEDYEASLNVLGMVDNGEPGTFHPDIEFPSEDNVDPNTIEVITSIWVVTKCYILLARAWCPTEKKYKYVYHRRGKGLKKKWVEHMDFLDYYNISRMPTKAARSVLKFTTARIISNDSYIRFHADKPSGTIKEMIFDRCFSHFTAIGKQRNFTEELQAISDPLENSTPVYIPSN